MGPPDDDEVDDIELLERWRRGDKRAGEKLFQRCYDQMERFFLNKLSDPHAVEDLVQQTFLACVEKPESPRNGNFRAYLAGIARHKLFDHLSACYQGKKYIDFEEASFHDLSPGPTSVLARRENQRLLLEGLRHIPMASQIVLELYYWEDFTTDEVATILEIPVGTLRGHLTRARRLLIKAMRRLADRPESFDATETDLDKWAASCRRLISGLTEDDDGGGDGDDDDNDDGGDPR